MIGFEIFDTYKAYKVREKKVTTWLKDTAAKFGFRSSVRAESETHQIRIREIPAAVRLIFSNGEYVFFDFFWFFGNFVCRIWFEISFYSPQPWYGHETFRIPFNIKGGHGKRKPGPRD